MGFKSNFWNYEELKIINLNFWFRNLQKYCNFNHCALATTSTKLNSKQTQMFMLPVTFTQVTFKVFPIGIVTCFCMYVYIWLLECMSHSCYVCVYALNFYTATKSSIFFKVLFSTFWILCWCSTCVCIFVITAWN